MTPPGAPARLHATPISHAIGLGAERIYVLPTRERWHSPGRPRGALDAALNALDQLLEGRLRADLARYAGQAELIVLPAPNPMQVQPTDFRHASQLIGEAHAAGRDLLTRRRSNHGHLSLLATTADASASRVRRLPRRRAPNITPGERRSHVDAHV